MTLTKNKNITVKQPVRHKELTSDVKGKLKLSSDLVNKIHLIHYKVDKNTEWSGILKYKILEGSIEDPENLIILAEDLLLMDIGSSAYTEYDFDTSDEKVANFILDAQLNGSKYGHIHSHHNMRCYFSGTDMGELHDNAPNHDVYLSLIVNYELEANPNWCAKICFITKEVQTGTRKVTNNISYQRFLNGSLNPWNSSVNDKEEEEEVNEEFTALNMIDLVLEEERTSFYQELLDRFEDVKPKKPAYTSYTSPYLNNAVGYTKHWENLPQSKSVNNKKPKNGYEPKSQVKSNKKKKGNRFNNQKDLEFPNPNDTKVWTPNKIFSTKIVEDFILEIINSLPSFKSQNNKINSILTLSTHNFYTYHTNHLKDFLSEQFEYLIFNKFQLALTSPEDETYLHLLGAKIMEVVEENIDFEPMVDVFEEFTEPLTDWDLMGPVETGMLLSEN